MKKMGESKDSVIWCRSSKKHEEQRPFEVDGKEIIANRCKQAKAKAGEKMHKEGGKEQLVCSKAWWRQSKIECALSEENASCWVHQDSHLIHEQKTALKKAVGVSRKTNVKYD